MLTRLGGALQTRLRTPWTDVVGTARTLLALGTAGTLLASSPATLFGRSDALPDAPYCSGLARYGAFCLPGHGPSSGRWVALAVLLVAASGWRPRWTALPHWWVTVSFATATTIPDGGDQVAAVLTLLLLPVALTDRRRWHWSPPCPGDDRREAARLVATAALALIALQVCGIYLNACIAKLGVHEWADGTALYYWLSDPSFGPPGWLSPAVQHVVTSSVGVVALTWGSLALEGALGLALLLAPRRRRWLLPLGVALHLFIAVLMGLISFALAMWPALLLYLWPAEDQLWPALAHSARRLGSTWARLRGAPARATATPKPGRRVNIPVQP